MSGKKNDPSRARVYIEFGEQVDSSDGILSYIATNGAIYDYEWGGDGHIVIVPADYPYRFLDFKRLIRVKAGELVATEWGKDIECKVPEVVAAQVIKARLVAQSVESISGKSDINWKKWLIIGAIVLVVGFIAWQFLGNKGGGVVPGVNESTPTPTIQAMDRWD